MNKTTKALTKEEYTEIIQTLRSGGAGFKPNDRVAMALIIEANLLIRVSDIVKLKLNDIIRDGERYRLDIVEQKTGKKRKFTVPKELYLFIQQYCIDNGIKSNELIIPLTTRQIQRQLKLACDYLELTDISTHSFRKFGATNIYVNNQHDIRLVQELLQHSSPTVSAKYIGISTEQLENALQNNLNLL